MLTIIAACIGAAISAAVVMFLMRPKVAPPAAPPSTPSPAALNQGPVEQPWDKLEEEPEGSKLASIPAPDIDSEEIGGLDGMELFFEDEDELTGDVPRILVSAVGETHPGQKRAHNEDAFLTLADFEVFGIADGMGGYAAGEVAAQIAVDTIQAAFENSDFGELEIGFPKRGAELMAAIQRANGLIREEAQKDRKKSGMGTTMVAALFSPGRRRVYIAHVGDSRCYRVRAGEIKQLTADHTLGAVGVTGPSAVKLSRAVGAFEDVDVDLTIDEPEIGDLYLLCSDGLYKMVADSEILTYMNSAHDIETMTGNLIDRANARGGRDNVTVVVVKVDDPFPDGDAPEA